MMRVMVYSRTMQNGLNQVAHGDWTNVADAALKALERRGLVTLAWSQCEVRTGPWNNRRVVGRTSVSKAALSEYGRRVVAGGCELGNRFW